MNFIMKKCVWLGLIIDDIARKIIGIYNIAFSDYDNQVQDE